MGTPRQATGSNAALTWMSYALSALLSLSIWPITAQISHAIATEHILPAVGHWPHFALEAISWLIFGLCLVGGFFGGAFLIMISPRVLPLAILLTHTLIGLTFIGLRFLFNYVRERFF